MQEAVAVRGGDGLGVVLHPPAGEAAVGDRHQGAVLGAAGQGEEVRGAGEVAAQGVVAGDGGGGGDAVEEGVGLVVEERADAAMPGGGGLDGAPGAVDEELHPQADAQQGRGIGGEGAVGVAGVGGLGRVAGAGGEDDGIQAGPVQRAEGRIVVLEDLGGLAGQDREVVCQDGGEGVVVIDEQQPHGERGLGGASPEP